MAVKDTHGVPERLPSCHTGVIEDYVIEGDRLKPPVF